VFYFCPPIWKRIRKSVKNCLNPSPPFPSTGSGDGQFRFPRGIALDSEGSVYVSDIIPNTKNYRVQKFTQEDQFLTSWGSLGGDSTDLNFNGYDVTVDETDNVYVADSFSDRVPMKRD
jgi:tripartite motif-containing protein 71